MAVGRVEIERARYDIEVSQRQELEHTASELSIRFGGTGMDRERTAGTVFYMRTFILPLRRVYHKTPGETLRFF